MELTADAAARPPSADPRRAPIDARHPPADAGRRPPPARSCPPADAGRHRSCPHADARRPPADAGMGMNNRSRRSHHEDQPAGEGPQGRAGAQRVPADAEARRGRHPGGGRRRQARRQHHDQGHQAPPHRLGLRVQQRLQDGDGEGVHRERAAKLGGEADEHHHVQEGGQHEGDHPVAGRGEEAEDLRGGRGGQPGRPHHTKEHHRQARLRAAGILRRLLQRRHPHAAEQQGLI